ncbi:signal peptidase I [Halosegnis marinus]|uniref:Signal peptidase I n=1 Tax=Halosegnis marinus TaxID=3034023 RepID=A0ABD5ZM57_9EURY|nr:signal peptidase I [Halosegnis sp. DT85]
MTRVTARRVAAVLGTLLLVAAVTPFVVFAVPQVVGADDGFVVLSGSMEPALSPGDVVIVDASTPVRVGDVITYRTGGESVPTTHRVVGAVDGGYETKGDANENVDAGVVPRSAVLGEVVYVIPLVGHVILWANTSTGYVALVVVPLVLLVANELWTWARRDREPDAPIPAVRRIDADPEPVPVANDDVSLAVVDLKLTVVAMAALFAYAAWNVYREYLAVAAPDPVSVGALTAGLLGLLFAGWVTLAAWRLNRAAASTAAPYAVQTDGGADTEVRDE